MMHHKYWTISVSISHFTLSFYIKIAGRWTDHMFDNRIEKNIEYNIEYNKTGYRIELEYNSRIE
jgi:hypothetical protein